MTRHQVIARYWRGLCKPEFADTYVEHLHSETLPALGELPGFMGASILRRSATAGVEYLVITHWSSMEAIHAFAGANAESAVVPAKVHEMMIECDRSVRHYEVVL